MSEAEVFAKLKGRLGHWTSTNDYQNATDYFMAVSNGGDESEDIEERAKDFAPPVPAAPHGLDPEVNNRLQRAFFGQTGI